MRRKKKPSIVINNRLKEFGNEEGGRIQINVKKHRGDKAELADTIFHERYHAKHPKATEKETYKKTHKAMKEMSYAEKEKLVAKVRTKSNHYKQGVLKRKFKMGRGTVEPGTYLRKLNESKAMRKSEPSKVLSKERLGIMGLI